MKKLQQQQQQQQLRFSEKTASQIHINFFNFEFGHVGYSYTK